MKGPLRQTITHVGQSYVDEPVYAEPKRKSIIEISLQRAWRPNARQPQRIQIGTQRVRFNWIKPSTKPTA
jgi:hypothetical protein